MDWMRAVAQLRRQREPCVLVTVARARGHAPRAAGAKMVVSASKTWETVGGGSLEARAIQRARELLSPATTPLQEPSGQADAHPTQRRVGCPPELLTVVLSDKAPYEHGLQCCGGEVTLLLEPLPVVPSVALFGVGHIGLELARILARQHLDLHLIDSREEQLSQSRLAVLENQRALVHVHHHVPVLPELVLGSLPAATHVLIMTHDHAEDAALCDAALRTPGLGSIGLIGSAAKWARFQQKLALEGGFDLTAIQRIKTPIGLPNLVGKDPSTIAVSVAADLLLTLENESAKR